MYELLITSSNPSKTTFYLRVYAELALSPALLLIKDLVASEDGRREDFRSPVFPWIHCGNSREVTER